MCRSYYRFFFHSVGLSADISCWSFCQDKIITTGGEGGMITTSRDDLWDFVWSFKDHGNPLKRSPPSSSNSFRWLHDSFGTNLRLTEFQSIIRLQLEKTPLGIMLGTRMLQFSLNP